MQKNIFTPDLYLPGHALEVVHSGEPYFIRLLQIIREAKKQIYFLVYIFNPDKTGQEVAEALKAAAKRGVQVFLAVDSYGSKALSPEFVTDLQQSGVHFKLFSPLPAHFYFFRLGRRLHSKVVVADATTALVGGVNIANKYRGSAQEPPWLDIAIGIQGPLGAGLQQFCERVFREEYFGGHKTKMFKPALQHFGDTRCRLVVNDWFRRKNQISAGYRAAFRGAQQSITIMAGYFLPSRSIRRALKNATARGVEVKILLPGKSDVPLAKPAIRYLYQWLLHNNIGIYEWDKSVLHGKVAVVDDKWVTIGSYNLNHLSQYSSIEMNVEVLDELFAKAVSDDFTDLIQQSRPVTADSFSHVWRQWDKLVDWASYTLARWMMLFLFFLVRRDHQYKEKE